MFAHIDVIRYLISDPKVKPNKFTIRNTEVVFNKKNPERHNCLLSEQGRKKKKKKLTGGRHSTLYLDSKLSFPEHAVG